MGTVVHKTMDVRISAPISRAPNVGPCTSDMRDRPDPELMPDIDTSNVDKSYMCDG